MEQSKAHPKFGTILASSSYDGHVLIWRSSPPTHKFVKVFDFALHTASVNLLSWAPHECGCILACASSDSNISVLEFTDGSWTHVMLERAHEMGVNSVSWAPSIRGGGLVSSKPDMEKGALRRFVSGGSDCLVKIWDWKYAVHPVPSLTFSEPLFQLTPKLTLPPLAPTPKFTQPPPLFQVTQIGSVTCRGPLVSSRVPTSLPPRKTKPSESGLPTLPPIPRSKSGSAVPSTLSTRSCGA